MKTLVGAGIIAASIALVPGMSATVQSPSAMEANATSAILTLRAILSGQVTYAVSCGNGGYATSLKVLATPPPGSRDGFLSPQLKPEQPERSGYQFSLAAGAKSEPATTDCAGNKTVTKFYATATPLKLGATGARSFAANDAGTIWVLEGGVAPKEPFGPPAKPLS